jgi:hypothetical protein
MGDLSIGTSPEEPPFPLTEVDKWVLSQTDEEFHCHDWEDLRKIIGRAGYTFGCHVPRLTHNVR